jgi:hypothetical protein
LHISSHQNKKKKNLECIINLLTDMLGKYADSRISLFGG